MLEYANLKALAVVVSEGGFERAAKVLHITQSAVSQRVRQLEERVGQSLLIRSTPVVATPTGKRLLRHYSQVQLLESELRAELDADDPNHPTTVRIAVNADSLATWFLPALADMFSRHAWLLELIVDDESYTHHLLKNGEAVGCVTTTVNPMAGCSSEFLGTMEYMCVATPAFAARYFEWAKNSDNVGAQITQAQLAKAPAVVFSTKDKMHEKYLAQYFQMLPGQWWQHSIPSSESFLEAINLSLGYGLVGHLQAKPLIDKGILIELTPEKRIRVPLYWQHWNIKAKQTTLVYRALAATAQHLLQQ
ncbi:MULTISPECIES: LysR family transcriptional regulator ArgP [Shewanella]|uniref:LysR family transcriptional regulator ArgP n=1 Tax=Shewanella TaxID=22 RepID=UPI000B3418EE|nr:MULTISPECIES: LysR family transcriptional regulator ArgP [Shewanella]QXN23483.1 LysR family transcriptional regulator ArgP [Shewanella putrefaciens]MCL1070768.1 LysR family transcriptional regulator ArgP [Shewanella xiamenensis]MCR4533060.1 LysR family transcriptional regulator ArgP [Shewanella xiamenensis]MDH0448276.1 LysR family transcriptional regulator ArgP [Shewanella sp. GD04112]MDH1314195.1 LysR family transcriptional regulator ArgP [Shewanella xiamenensis]